MLLSWDAVDLPASGWICSERRRLPLLAPGRCPRCSGPMDVSHILFHPGSPVEKRAVCFSCLEGLVDMSMPLPDEEEAWVYAEYVEESMIAPEDVCEGDVPSSMMAVEPVESEAPVSESPFEGADLEGLPGSGWRISTRGNLFASLKKFHVIMFFDKKKQGFKLIIDGKFGKIAHPSPKAAAGAAVAAVTEMVCRGIVPLKVREKAGGEAVAGQREFRL